MRTNVYESERILAMDYKFSTDSNKTSLNNNVLLVAATGAGKTGSYVIPNLQSAKESLIIADTKGNLYDKFKSQLIKNGYIVKKIDFVHPVTSVGYNPLSYIRKGCNGLKYSEKDVLSLARAIIPELDQTEPIWEMSARMYLSFLISYCMETIPKKEQNMITICKLHHAFIQPKGELSFLDYILENPESYASQKYYEMQANMPAEKMWASIIGFVNVALEPFSFNEAKYMFEKNKEFDLRTIGNRKTALFLNISDSDRISDSLVNIFYTQLFQVLFEQAQLNLDYKLKVPVHIIMDDFAAGTKMDCFDRIISVIRSRGISVSIILQSLSQLTSLYGENCANTILNNCDHILSYGTNDITTAEYLANRSFKTPESIMCMQRDKVLILPAGNRAFITNKIPPYSAFSEETIHLEKTTSQKGD